MDEIYKIFIKKIKLFSLIFKHSKRLRFLKTHYHCFYLEFKIIIYKKNKILFFSKVSNSFKKK
jgi:hypothetical protein